MPPLWKVVPPLPLPKNIFLRVVAIFTGMIMVLCNSPRVLLKYVNLERKDGNGWKGIFENIFLNAHILSHKLDWLHFGFSAVALRRENVANAIGAKMAVSFRGYDIAVYPLKHKDCYKLHWSKVDKVHTISNDLLQRAYKLGLPSDTPHMTIPPAIDAGKFDGNECNPLGGELQILTVARLTWIKGLSYALSAMKILKESGVKFHYTIVGDGEERDNLSFIVHQLGLQREVTLLGKIKSEQLPSYFHQSDIYLQPSVHEGFCNAALEAQAAGLLCIVTGAGGLKENVIDKKTGWVVDARNPQAIADAIIDASELPKNEKDLMISFAQKRITDTYTLNTQRRSFNLFYD